MCCDTALYSNKTQHANEMYTAYDLPKTFTKTQNVLCSHKLSSTQTYHTHHLGHVTAVEVPIMHLHGIANVTPVLMKYSRTPECNMHLQGTANVTPVLMRHPSTAGCNSITPVLLKYSQTPDVKTSTVEIFTNPRCKASTVEIFMNPRCKNQYCWNIHKPQDPHALARCCKRNASTDEISATPGPSMEAGRLYGGGGHGGGGGGGGGGVYKSAQPG